MHNSLKRAVSIAIAAIALFSLPCGSIFARTHIDIDKKCSITVDIPDTWEDLYTVDFPVELYRVADVDENDVYTATKQFDELAKSISDISSKTTADDWEKMAKTAADIADKGSLTADEVIDVSNGRETSQALRRDCIWCMQSRLIRQDLDTHLCLIWFRLLIMSLL